MPDLSNHPTAYKDIAFVIDRHFRESNSEPREVGDRLEWLVREIAPLLFADDLQGERKFIVECGLADPGNLETE